MTSNLIPYEDDLFPDPPRLTEEDWHKKLEQIEAAIIANGGEYQGIGEEISFLPLTHRFTPGMYIREIFMPAGKVITSKVHRTEHPYIISRGVVSVFIPGIGPQTLTAPHFGITKSGTRRLLYIHEDTVWTTFHATDLTDIVELENYLSEPHLNPYLPEWCKQQVPQLSEKV